MMTRASRLAAAAASEIREHEARRIAGVLHDESSQLIAAISMKLGVLAGALPGQARAQVEDIQQFLRALQNQLRTLSHELRPPMLDQMGLDPTLEFLSRSFGVRHGIEVTFSSRPHRRYPVTIETAIYRFVFEALTNIAKHARATQMWLTLHHTREKLVCRVEDNGIGAAATPKRNWATSGLGLRGLRERVEAVGGSFTIHGHPGQGTVVMAEIPLRSSRPQASKSVSETAAPQGTTRRLSRTRV